MNNKPLVSVIIANYNAEKFLRESLNSVLNQSIENIEIILVDDNSTDKSKNIAFELASSDDRLKVVCLEKIRGHRAHGIRLLNLHKVNGFRF